MTDTCRKYVKISSQESKADSNIFNDHHKEGKLDSKCFLGIGWALYECRTDVCAHDLKD